jgi:hypothetical protein
MEIKEFIGEYPAKVATIANELRAFVMATDPEATETLHIGWKVISYGRKQKFCAIAPHGQWVNLQFHNGAGLTDPDGLLEGMGRNMRHVKVKSKDDLSASLKNLIEQAAKAAE